MAGKKKRTAEPAENKNSFAGGSAEKGSRAAAKVKKRQPGAHQPRDADAVSGHDVRKPGGNASAGETTGGSFQQKQNVFTEENGGQTRTGEDHREDYRRRDTYHQSEKKGRYRRREHQDRERTKQSDFERDFQTQDAAFTQGDVTFTEDSGEFSHKKSDKLREKADKARKRAERAKERLPKARDYTFQRTIDQETGKVKYRLVPEDRQRPVREAGIGRMTARSIGWQGRKYVHNKISEAEQDNSAVEAAHKSEQKAEGVYHFVQSSEAWKNHRLKTGADRLEKKYFEKEAKFRYQLFLEENPQLDKKALQKRIQKQRIKREYVKAERRRKASGAAKEAVGKAAANTTALARKMQESISRNAGLLGAVAIVALLLVILVFTVSSCGAMFADMQGTVLAASYLSKPAEIDKADLQFSRLETALQKEIDSIETAYPGYDEYDYNLAEIGHDPFVLVGYLSAVYTEFTADAVEQEVQSLYDEMYSLTIVPDQEIRVREVQAVDENGEPLFDEDGKAVMEEEEYEVSILRVTLAKKPLESITAGKMNAEQREIYGLYEETKGLLQIFDSPTELCWYHYISSYYGYRLNPDTKNEELHRGLDIALPVGEKIYAAHDGTITAVSYDSYYGNYVVLEKDGYTTKYAHMDSLNVSTGQTVAKGTLIGRSGNTGSSTGSHLHMECLYNGEFYNPLFYFDVGSRTLYGESAGGDGETIIPPDSYGDAAVQALMREAEKYLGYSYVWGGSDPSTGFDCSGFVCWVYTHSGVHNLPRTTAQGIYNQCAPVAASEAQPGDVIFFTGTYSSGSPVTHVGIYCGNGVMIHCGDPIGYASVNSPYWQSHFYGFGRLQ